MAYSRKTILIVLLFTGLRIILSFFLDLGNDESYYWTYSRHLQWNYFDHPPMVAVWIRFFTLDLLLQDHVFFLRLGSFISCAAASYFMYRAIKTISTEKAAFAGVFLFNCSFYAGITAGLLITPDTPQLLFWTAGMFLFTKISEVDSRWRYWILFGIVTGLCIMSKLHGVFLWFGMLCYALFFMRKWFLRPHMYVAGLLTLCIISPIIFWNINNDFITYRFHSERVKVGDGRSLNWFGPVREFIGQLIINNPFNVVLIFIFLFSKKYTLKNIAALRMFKLCSIPLLIIIFFIAFFRLSLPHWSGPVYICLIPIAAIGLSEMNRAGARRIFRWATAYSIVYILLIIAAVNYYPGTFGFKTPPNLGKGDISLDAYGWKEAGEQFVTIYNSREKDASARPPLICHNWSGAHEEYYFARPVKAAMVGLGEMKDLHNYTWTNKFISAIPDPAYCIIHSDEYYDVQKTYRGYYESIDSLTTIHIMRNNKPAHDFTVYRLSGWKNKNISN
ncbi:MAG: glycosyltransferase family 39 protein [Ferruginibacter sp.]